MAAETKVAWLNQAEQSGWPLPKVSKWHLRLPIVRHVRAMTLTAAVEFHYLRMENMGFGWARTGYDEWMIDGIWAGWC